MDTASDSSTPSLAPESGVGVLDKAMIILAALAAGPLSLGDLVTATGLPRPTAHRLAVALERHGMIDRDAAGRFRLGPRTAELAAARGSERLVVIAQPLLAGLRDRTGESAQLYRRDGGGRVCVAGADRAQGLRDTVPVGAVLTMTAGSAAQVLVAWDPPADLSGCSFSQRTLATVRRQGYAHSIGEREPGVGSVSAPVWDPAGRVVAAVSVSGPVERLGKDAGNRMGPVVKETADRLGADLAATSAMQPRTAV